MGAISEYDREMTVDRLAAGRAAKAARGGHAHGALPYGYRSTNGELVPVPAEQAALAKMRALSSQGVSTRASYTLPVTAACGHGNSTKQPVIP